MAEPDVDEVRRQLIDAFEGADYPVSNPMELLPALPNGPATTFESGDFEMSVMELQSASGGGMQERFPYDSPEEIADDVIEGLQDAGELPEN
ncbi:MTH865 family protein [Natrialbaceae archaeon GCM10025810]|uniref:MTH865 family protein n=1 Tax=Halovalidus salilacus TaxID=3075124 RepID=UPI003615DEF7